MSDAMKISEMWMNASSVSSLVGLSLMLADANGNPAKASADMLVPKVKDSIRDLDQVYPTGFYLLGYPATGLPPGVYAGSMSYSLCFIWTPTVDYSIQFIMRASGSLILVRNYLRGEWLDWYQIPLTKVAS